jgi:signal transduction histidine kinase
MNQKLHKGKVVFYLLAVYVLFQFFWWAYHIIRLEQQIRDLQLSAGNADSEAVFQNKVLMVAGEGLVFALLLLSGIWFIQRSLKKEAQLAMKEKNFMLAVTHELKTPVSTTRLLLQTMLRKGVDEQHRIKMTESAIAETHRLEYLVQNILLSTKLEHKNQEVTLPFDVKATLERVAERIKLLFGNERKLRISWIGGTACIGDEELFETLAMNLIENAFKYSPDGTDVEIEVSNENHFELKVLDRGPGVEKSQQTRIFEKFFRLGSEETRTAKGTGLGLYIARQIVLMHKGKIAVEDRVGGGACFKVTLPNR